MNSRVKHTGKTQQQRQDYGRYIRYLDSEPTLDEGIDFGSTEKGGEDLSESTSRRRPRGYTKNLIKEYLKEHFIELVH